jgi:hypothetical protein
MLMTILFIIAVVPSLSAFPVAAAPSNSVLILGSTIVNGDNSLEAQAIRAVGLNPVIVDPTTWSLMSASQFASYRAIVLGDPACDSETTPEPYDAATASAAIWGSVTTGNVIVIGTDPVFHSYNGMPGGTKLVNAGIAFAVADSSRTGAYINLSCSYHGSLPTTVPVLSPFGSFEVHGVGCADDIHIVAHQAALTNLTDADLTGWGWQLPSFGDRH